MHDHDRGTDSLEAADVLENTDAVCDDAIYYGQWHSSSFTLSLV